MSYLDHIRACNSHDPAHFVPFLAGGKAIGRVHRDTLAALAPYRDRLRVAEDEVTLLAPPETATARTEAIRAVTTDLRDRGLIAAWRDEPYAAATCFGAEPLFEIERAAVPLFGLRSWGVHVNGIVRKGKRLHLWVPRRAADRAVAPGKLDNIVAGGQPAGLGLRENLVKEAAEEASIPAVLARSARPVGCVSYRMEVPGGFKPDLLFCYDLDLPPDFRPRNTDGEVSDFRLLPVDEVMRIVRESDAFKFNVNLVLIDLFVRHGLVDPDGEPDYEAIVEGLRG